MKKILGYAMLFLLMGTGMQAQDFDLDDIMGEAQDFFGEAQDEAEKAADTEAMKDFKKKLNEKIKVWGGFVNELDNYSPEVKCTYMLLKYKKEFDSLVAKTNAAENCKKKYDLYGMQLMAMASSTSLVYCSKDLGDLVGADTKEEEDKLERWVTEITQILEIGYASNDLEKTFLFYKDELFWRVLLKNITSNYDKIKRIDITLHKYWHPISIIKTTASISKQMDALKPCTGY